MLRVALICSVPLLAGALLVGTSSASRAEDETIYTFTPRAWFSFVNSSRVYPDGHPSVSHTALPLYGGSIAATPAGWGGATFSLTAFYGGGSGEYHEGDTTIFSGNHDLTRFDIEGVAQFPIGTAGAYWLLGLRYVRADSEETGADNFLNPFRFASTSAHYLAELGVGASTPLNSSGSQRLFGGLTLVAGVRHTRFDDFCCVNFSEKTSFTDTVAGVDTNFGYAANLGFATFYARYRLFVLTDVEDFATSKSLDVVHGPEFNLTFKLN
jgi:hypothetical protein